jgi:hypothetical protein
MAEKIEFPLQALNRLETKNAAAAQLVSRVLML